MKGWYERIIIYFYWANNTPLEGVISKTEDVSNKSSVVPFPSYIRLSLENDQFNSDPP